MLHDGEKNGALKWPDSETPKKKESSLKAKAPIWSLVVLLVPSIVVFFAAVSTLLLFGNMMLRNTLFTLVGPFVSFLFGPVLLLVQLGLGIWLLPVDESAHRSHRTLIICSWLLFCIPGWLVSMFVAGFSAILDM